MTTDVARDGEVVTGSSSADPYLLVLKRGRGFQVVGTPAVRVGHPWPRDPGSADVSAEWLWDGDTLSVRNDAWGFQPVFYFADADRVAVSTSIPMLIALGAPTALDDAAMSVFLRVSHFLGGDTPFEAIRALTRGSTLAWRAGTLRVSSSVSRPLLQVLSRDSAIDGYITLFREAVRKRLPVAGQPVIVPLSGGHDSRHLLFELVEQNCAPKGTVTVHHHPPQGNDDARIAPLVAAAAGVPNVVLPYDPRRVRAERRKNVMTSFCADRHVQMLPVVEYLRGRADVIYDGLGGDILSGTRLELAGHEATLLLAGRVADAATQLLTAHSDEAALRAILQPDAWRRFAFDVARARLEDELRRHVESPHPWGSYRLANRTARSVALLPFAMLARACRVMTPYVDADLAGFLMTLPTSALADGRLHREVIARAYPRHPELPYEDRRCTAGRAAGYYRRLCWEVAREALGRRRSPLVHRRFLASRLLARAASGAEPWIPVRRAILLMQLEEVLE